MKCHICNAETEYCCERCDEPVCEGCCVLMTAHRLVDYTLCTKCDEAIEAQDYILRDRQWKQEIAEKKKRDARNAQRRKNYWKPENVEKRRLSREKRRKDMNDLVRKQLKSTLRIMGELFGEM